MNEDKQITEAMDILQEECAEVIQAVSKIRRFGYETRHPTPESPSNRQHLEMEVGDLLAMIDVLIAKGVLSDSAVNDARHKKIEKLKVWSGIKL